MCGFLALYGKDLPDFHKLKDSLEIMSHRGPDNTKIFTSNNLWFGFNRLKIIDISDKSNMPLKYGPLTLMLNGQIFNYLEIKKKLISENITFKTSGDVEVLAASIYAYGIQKTLRLIKGMWSFICHDNRDDSIFVSRDPFGKKPLWQAKINSTYIFSSEIKSILKLYPSLKEIDKMKVSIFLKNGDVGIDNNCFFQNIKTFPINTYGILKNNKIDYYKDKTIENLQNNKPNSDDLKLLLDNAIKSELKSDVPIALTLSGGLDSTYLAKIMNSEVEFKSYSLLTDVDKNEQEDIKRFVDKLKLDHEFIESESSENIETIDKLINYFDRPFKSPQTISQYALRKKIYKDGFKVLITGDGADEIFCGYKNLIYSCLASNLFHSNDKYFLRNLKSISSFYGIPIYRLLIDTIKYVLVKIKNYKKISNTIDPLQNIYSSINKLKKYDIKFNLLNRLFNEPLPYWLNLEDNLSMMFSIENRTPYLNFDLLNYMINIDPSYYMKVGNKYMMRQAISKELPKNILDNKEKKQKPNNPGRVIFDSLINEASEIFLDYNSKYIFGKKIFVDDFINDSKSKKKGNYWFRLLVLTRWKKLIYQNN